jgi:hypothetical protein
MAEAKARQGLRRAQYRGRAKVRIQALGAAMAYNIKKLVRWHGRRPQDPAPALRPRAHPPVGCLPAQPGSAHHVCQLCQPFSHN